VSSLIAAEGGYQDFILQGGEWAVLILSAAAALVAIAVGVMLARNVMAQDEGTPKMKEIAKAIQEGASAYLRRQFKTIAVILVPLAFIVFLTSTAIKKPDGTELDYKVAGVVWSPGMDVFVSMFDVGKQFDQQLYRSECRPAADETGECVVDGDERLEDQVVAGA